MKKTITIFVVVAMTCLLTWKFVQSDGHEQPASDMDENQVIVAEYKWNDDTHQISLADLKRCNRRITRLPSTEL